MNTGDLAKILDFNSLFQRIKTVRDNHANASAQLGTLSAFTGDSGIAQYSTITTNPIEQLKLQLTELSKSKWYTSGTTSSITTMSDYGTSITIPDIGTLIKATDFNTIETAITAAENAPLPSYSSKYSQYGNYSSKYSQYSKYSNYSSKYSQYGKYSKYGNYSSKYSNYSSRYSKFQYTSCS